MVKELVLYTGDNLAVCNDMANPPAYEAGGAGLASTLDDYSRFAGMLLNGGSLTGFRFCSRKQWSFLRMESFFLHSRILSGTGLVLKGTAMAIL